MVYGDDNRRILVVDDTESIHKDIRAILSPAESANQLDELELMVLGIPRAPTNEKLKYTIESAYQGEEGFERVVQANQEGNPFALAIVDVRMPPGWDGVETVTRMREVDPQLQTAICTAYSDYSWQSIHDQFGTNDWLLIFKKPFDIAEVQQLACAMTEKWNLAQKAALKVDQLEQMVEVHARKLSIANAELGNRNVTLADTNDRLSCEIEARRNADERIRHIAFHDALTDLPNRALLMERMNNCIERSKRQSDYLFAVLFTDVDDFKSVNDSLGHRVGDQLLIQIATNMTGALRTMDGSLRPSYDTVARLGGDEFVVLLDDIKDVDTVVLVAERIQRAVCQPMSVDRRQILPSMSVGIAVSENDYDDVVDIMRDADTALYHAKENGKGRVALFDQPMRTRVLERVDLERDLSRAIEREQFVVHYQPIVDLNSGKVNGLEALVRWQHPTRGLLQPEAFLRVAEEIGMIEAIGEIVLEEVAQQLSDWTKRLPMMENVSISLNLAACQLLSNNLVMQIDRCLKKYDLESSSLKLELTESMMMGNLATVRSIIDEMTSRHIEIYLDDFGTGYSSLSVLHTLPFAALKLDRSFISTLGKDPECAITIQAIVMMAKNRNIKLIAEGVETYEQLSILRELDCEYCQGYYFSRPIPAEQMEELLVESNGKFATAELAIS